MFGIALSKPGIAYLLGSQSLAAKCFWKRVIVLVIKRNDQNAPDTIVKNAAVWAIVASFDKAAIPAPTTVTIPIVNGIRSRQNVIFSNSND